MTIQRSAAGTSYSIAGSITGGKSLGTRAGTTVQVATDGHDIIATYQLSAFQLVADVEPGGGAMPPAPLPAILVSHLAVDLYYQHRGLGTGVLVHALQVADRAAPALGVRVMVAQAVGEPAAGFCRRLGFRPFDTDPHYLYLLAQDIRATLQALV